MLREGLFLLELHLATNLIYFFDGGSAKNGGLAAIENEIAVEKTSRLVKSRKELSAAMCLPMKFLPINDNLMVMIMFDR
jgi:hypothetical protein